MTTAVHQRRLDPATGYEERFRAYYHAQDRGVYRTGIILLAAPILLFSHSDYLLFGMGPMFQVLFTVRVLFLALTVGTILVISRNKSSKRSDWVVSGWCLALAVVVIFINSSRPPDYILHSVLDVLILMTLYFLFPLPAPLHAIGPVVFSTGNLFMIYTIKTPITPLETNVLLITYTLGNALGLYTAHRMNRYRRGHFQALDQEQALRVELEEALLNLNVLRGMLPICAHCKKVRDDQGYWTQIEHYIRSHSEAQFTHGICPDCIAEHYGDVALEE